MKGLPRPVRCIETGQVYRSQRAAAAAYGTHANLIGQVIAGQLETAGGVHWERISNDVEPHPRSRPVVLDDGRVFPSARQAAIALGGTSGNLTLSIRYGWTFCGHRVRWGSAPSATGGDRHG